MRHFLAKFALGCALVAEPCVVLAQSETPSRGTNLDPPPQIPQKPLEEPQPPPPEPAKPLIAVDWTDRMTWVKFGLLFGSALLGLRAFRQMRD